MNNGHRLQPKYAKPNEPQIYKMYYLIKIEINSSTDFVKHVYSLPNTRAPVLIHYIGNEQLFIQSSHGNAKNKNNIFERPKNQLC